MAIGNHMTVWAGKPIVDWNPEVGLTDPSGTAYRVRAGYRESQKGIFWADRIASLLQDPRSAELTALVIGTWGQEWNDSSAIAVEALTGAADHLPNLTSLFLGDITYEENEISWIVQSDLSPLFNAYPHLEHVGVRGGGGLSLGKPYLSALKTLIIETGGMPSSVLDEAFAADVPVLEHLELWLGTSEYGGGLTPDNLRENLSPLLGQDAPKKWPALRYLGLRNAEFADEIAQALVGAPLLAQLEILDVSLGTLSDAGAAALATNPVTDRLRKLDIHHHFVSPEGLVPLAALGVEVDASEPQEADEDDGEVYRYVATGSESEPRRWVILGNPDSRRVALFQEVLAAAGKTPAVLVAWADFLDGRAELNDKMRAGDIVRIESPGRDFGVEKRLLARGALAPDEAGNDAFAGSDASFIATLPFDKGEILFPRQWYRGFRNALEEVTRQLAAAPEHHLLNDPAEIALLFDKSACHARLAQSGIPVPPTLGIVHGYEDLTARMARAGVNRVFLKLTHGSSASGVIAYRRDAEGKRHQAMTTVEVAASGGETRLYNTRQVRTLTDVSEVAALVDALSRHRVHVEEWLPKASLPGMRGAFDVRALSVAGRLRHVVARCSATPMTNLHLLNQRASGDTVRETVGASAWERLNEIAERAARTVFPRSLQIGLDVMWTPGFHHLAVLEANAFGDLLPGAMSEGESPYEAQIRAVEAGRGFRPAPAWASISVC